MGSDTLSDVLRAVRLTGAVFYDLHAASPWSEEVPPGAEIARGVLPGVQHLIPYHMLTEGTCWACAPGQPHVRLEAGDVVVFPQGDPHVLCSEPGLRSSRPPRGAGDYAAAKRKRLPVEVQSGGCGPEKAHIVCGFLGCDVRPFNPLIAALPRIFTVHDRAGVGPASLTHLVQLALTESVGRRSGGEAVLARLSELLFVEVVRRHLEGLPEDRTGWLAGLRDPFVGRALTLLHDRPSYPWSLASLASEAGVSRSTLAERFTLLVGHPPMQYLLRWRLQLAATLLSQGAKVAAAALEVGYDSEAAFSRAFKRVVGLPPASWRNQQAAEPTALRPGAIDGVARDLGSSP